MASSYPLDFSDRTSSASTTPTTTTTTKTKTSSQKSASLAGGRGQGRGGGEKTSSSASLLSHRKSKIKSSKSKSSKSHRSLNQLHSSRNHHNNNNNYNHNNHNHNLNHNHHLNHNNSSLPHPLQMPMMPIPMPMSMSIPMSMSMSMPMTMPMSMPMSMSMPMPMPLSCSPSSSSALVSLSTSKLSWNGYEEEILSAFEEFWRLGEFVDVTLICDDVTIRAHRIVLAANSEYFERIFLESECKSPVILLKGFEGWEVEACVEFMYRGIIQVPSDKVNDIVNTAGVLEIRGLADYVTKLDDMVMAMRMPLKMTKRNGNSSGRERDRGKNRERERERDGERDRDRDRDRESRDRDRVKTPTTPTAATANTTTTNTTSTSRDSSVIMMEEALEPPNMAYEFDNNPRSPKCLNLSMAAHLNENPQTTAASILLRQSPLRRKQAKPRRRSGDYVAQDLRKVNPDDEDNEDNEDEEDNQVIDYTTAKDSHLNSQIKSYHDHLHRQLLLRHHHHDLPPIIQQHSPPSNSNCINNNNTNTTDNNNTALNNNHNNNNNNSDDGISSSNCVISPASSPPFFFPKASPPSPEEGHACSTPPIFPPFTNGFGQPGHGWPGLPLGPAPIFGRHRAQHSAPRGGPPRAWSNADLTEALHNVWNKKMTTSQASRIFGIPYNSLLMYVRGKYGKSLKLDLLKKGLDLAMENKKNMENNNSKSPESNTPDPFNPFTAGIFGEYPTPFPFATALSHILPPPGMDTKIELGKTEDMK